MSELTQGEKWKEIQRNLAEQESFVNSITQRKDHQAKIENDANVDNILSSSIQKAKQKINLLESKHNHLSTSRQKLSLSRQRKDKPNEETSAIAGAMKKLQEKITHLERQRQSIIKENKILKNQIQHTREEKQVLQASYEESRRKSKNLEASLINDKNHIKELENKVKMLEKTLGDKKMQKKESQLQEKLSTSEMLYRAQNQEMKNILVQQQKKQKQLLHLQNLRKQQQIRHLEAQNQSKVTTKELESQVRALEQKDRKKQMLIEKLKQEIKNLEIEKNQSRMNLTAIQLSENSNVKEGKIMQSPVLSQRQKYLSDELEEQRQKYDQLFHAYKTLDQKNKREKASAKNFRNKFWEMEELTKEIIQKINVLPNALTSQLRYLIVKFNKMEAFGPEYYASTPTKSSRKRSTVGATQRSYSKSRSKSKSKPVNLGLHTNKSIRNYNDDVLNCSKNSAKSNRSSKSIRNQSKKSITGKNSKEKQVIISQKSINNSQIKILEQQIQEIRKRYKELINIQDKEQEQVGEDLRNQLNQLVGVLSMKSEQLTKLKKKK